MERGKGRSGGGGQIGCVVVRKVRIEVEIIRYVAMSVLCFFFPLCMLTGACHFNRLDGPIHSSEGLFTLTTPIHDDLNEHLHRFLIALSFLSLPLYTVLYKDNDRTQKDHSHTPIILCRRPPFSLPRSISLILHANFIVEIKSPSGVVFYFSI